MRDPYGVLGVSPSATPDEVTAAYRKLAKKYHPDLNPGDAGAEEKMREINAAYEQIKSGKVDSAGGRSGYPGGQRTYRGEDPYGGFEFVDLSDLFGDLFSGMWQQQQRAAQDRSGDSPMVRQTRTYIRNRQYRDALRVLEQMPKKNAEWYYLSALANAGVGNRVTALSNAKTAAQMEPNNEEYRQLVDQFEGRTTAYRRAGTGHGFDMQRVGRTMMGIVAAQMCCFFCCRPC